MADHRNVGLAAIDAARELVGPIIAMTVTLAAVYAPVGIQGGLTGALFREFAFTLAGSVIVSGVIALTLSPMMCSMLLKNTEEGRFAKLVNKVFGALTRWYGRKGAAMSALGAIDMALWDLRGQSLGKPVWKLLGGTKRECAAYASGLLWKTPEGLAEEAAGHLAQGFRRMKMRMGRSE